MQALWSLYNKEDKLRIDDLTPEQVKTILLAIPTSRMKDWFACRGGEVHWHAISEIPEFYEDVRALRGVTQAGLKEAASPSSDSTVPTAPPAPAKPATPHRPLFEEHANATMPTLAVDNVQSKERRSARRYQCRLDFKVIQGGKAFNSETADVSMTGMALKESLPTWIPKTFRAQVSHNGQVLSIVAARVEKAGANRLRILEAENWEILRRWIVNW
jgi:hypothetical protein